MFQIPQHVIENLKCSVCDGYLSSKPLMLNPENEQICGKCFKIIPTEEKEKCLRQIGLETLAEVLIFPCRYNKQGCDYTFSWGNERNHEEECRYRYETLPRLSDSDISKKPAPKNEFKCESDSVKARFSYEFKETKYPDVQNLTYLLDIEGNCGKTLSVKSDNTEVQNNVKLSIEGAVSLKDKPELLYSDIKIKPKLEENIYEYIFKKSVSEKQCFNCKSVVGDDVYNCLFGHVSCANCKGSMCLMCVKLLERDSKKLCKNYYKGCKNIFPQSEITKHEINCAYNEISCPLDTCKFKSVLSQLKEHLKETHQEKVVCCSEVEKNFRCSDDTIIIICHESIFKCVYFYYKTFVEFFVTYIGPSDDAANYTYQISVQSNGNSLKMKRSKCGSWNNSMLDRGITFDRKDLLNSDKRLNFDICLRIVHTK